MTDTMKVAEILARFKSIEDAVYQLQGEATVLKLMELQKRVLDIDPQIQSLKGAIDSLILIVAGLEERIFTLESRADKAETP